MKKMTQRQQDIIKASTELISNGGIQNFTIKALASKLNVSEPAIYRHFESKWDILHNILLELEEENIHLRKEVNGNKLSINKLEMMFTMNALHFTANPAKAAIIFSEEIFQNDKRLSELVLSIMNERQKIILTIIDYEQKNGVIRTDIPAEQLSFIIMGFLRLIISRWRLAEYKFDLNEEMKKVWISIEKILKS